VFESEYLKFRGTCPHFRPMFGI